MLTCIGEKTGTHLNKRMCPGATKCMKFKEGRDVEAVAFLFTSEQEIRLLVLLK